MKNWLWFLLLTGLVAGVYFLGSGKMAAGGTLKKSQDQARENALKIEILAKNGYSPLENMVEANRPIDLKVKTQNTFDCSADFRIRRLGIATVLKPNNEEIFQLPPLAPGEEIQGSCGMGMYGFVIKAKG